MTNAERVHQKIQANLRHLKALEENGNLDVPESYMLDILKAIDGKYDDAYDLLHIEKALYATLEIFKS